MGFRDNERSPQNDREPRINHRIRVPEVRVVSDSGEQLGIMPVEEALRLAQEEGLDLVEVAPMARPPVCRVMDYGKYKYLEKKRTNDARKNQTHVEVKEVKLRLKTDAHDLDTKTNHVRRFLLEGDKVKVTLMFRGRELAYQRNAEEKLLKLVAEVSDIGIVEREPKLEGRNMSLMMSPKPQKGQQGGHQAGGSSSEAPRAAQSAPPAPGSPAKAPPAKAPPAQAPTAEASTAEAPTAGAAQGARPAPQGDKAPNADRRGTPAPAGPRGS